MEYKPNFENVRFSELFDLQTLGTKKEIRHNQSEKHKPSYIQTYVSITDYRKQSSNRAFRSFYMMPSKLTLDYVNSEMFSFNWDRIYFNVIIFANNTARVFAKYNSIIGSRFLAEITDLRDLDFIFGQLEANL